MTHYDEGHAASKAHREVQKALLDLAASAIREAFVARASDGLQLALDLTVTTERHRLRSALPMIAYDATSRQLRDILVGVCNALREFDTKQHDTPEERRSLAESMNAALTCLASEAPKRCPRDERVVILRSVNDGVFYRGEPSRKGVTFVEYKLDTGGFAKVSKRGATEYVVVV
jgi:hypothetical protein